MFQHSMGSCEQSNAGAAFQGSRQYLLPAETPHDFGARLIERPHLVGPVIRFVGVVDGL
jgi:hypothetical protein